MEYGRSFGILSLWILKRSLAQPTAGYSVSESVHGGSGRGSCMMCCVVSFCGESPFKSTDSPIHIYRVSMLRDKGQSRVTRLCAASAQGATHTHTYTHNNRVDSASSARSLPGQAHLSLPPPRIPHIQWFSSV